jgi:hypothetical protein
LQEWIRKGGGGAGGGDVVKCGGCEAPFLRATTTMPAQSWTISYPLRSRDFWRLSTAQSRYCIHLPSHVLGLPTSGMAKM